LLYTSDGRRIGRLDPVFKGDLPIHEAQIIQEALDSVTVRYVPTRGFNDYHEKVIVQRLQERMGNIKVAMEQLTEIPRESNGKFRAVVSKLPRRSGDFSTV
jgi:phenylacetate-CoA ligase